MSHQNLPGIGGHNSYLPTTWFWSSQTKTAQYPYYPLKWRMGVCPIVHVPKTISCLYFYKMSEYMKILVYVLQSWYTAWGFYKPKNLILNCFVKRTRLMYLHEVQQKVRLKIPMTSMNIYTASLCLFQNWFSVPYPYHTYT